MKIVKIIMIIALCAVLELNISNVRAENSPIQIQGNDVAKLGEEQTVVVKFSKEQTVGVISGKMECSSEIKSMEVRGKNNWTALYNPATKQFTAYKAEGATAEDFMEVVITMGNTIGKAKITLKDVKMTTIQYETIEIPDEIIKEVEIKDESNIDEDKKDENKIGNTTVDDKNNQNTSNNGNNTNTNNNANNNTNTDTKSQNKVMIKNDNTVKKGILPQTGISRTIVITAIIILIAGVITGFYFCRKNKDI